MVDFLAQSNGLQEALVDYLYEDWNAGLRDPPGAGGGRAHAGKIPRSSQDRLQGCKEHLRRNAARIAQLAAFVGNDGAAFTPAIIALMASPTVEEGVEKSGKIKQRWPLVAEWLGWWERDRETPVRQGQFDPPPSNQDNPDGDVAGRFELHPPAETSNAVEKMNQELYMAGNGANPFTPHDGVSALFDYTVMIESVMLGTQGMFLVVLAHAVAYKFVSSWRVHQVRHFGTSSGLQETSWSVQATLQKWRL